MSATLSFPNVFVDASKALNHDEARISAPWLVAFRESQQHQLEQCLLPTRKTEDWRYSSRHLKMSDAIAKPLVAKANVTLNNEFVDLDGYLVVFVNGHFAADKSRLPQDAELTIKAFANLSNEEAEQVVASSMSAAEAKHSPISPAAFPFTAINAAYLSDGVYISVPKNVKVNKPIQVQFHSEGEGTASARVFLVAEQGAEATLVEEFSGSTETELLTTSVTDIYLKEQSQIHYVRLNTEQQQISHVGITKVTQHRNSRFSSHCIGLGGALRRHDLKVKLIEPGAECSLDGVCVTLEKQHYDNHTEIEHVSAHCQSEENYRCIAGDQSHIVFNGRIMIHRDAQKTSGAMSNKNLLLSSNAEIDTKPELEIYADDVKCAHGTTIGQLDEEELYYLVTRGISPDNAATMLTLGFVNELVQKIPNDTIREKVEKRLESLIQSAFIEV
ncbi:Fe-S cluster assembly protein SufD [Alkalimarinus sediminis]|uniref:Fe-S cluster assembly protein SufD n=1 Tax=Alkalimarinus sediminis TaxID=1632866 RepID=A0A9E8KP13_9ALTE|nr:Fe-S cluster assembly protein SufD [Alkalimarinus sediminis]UZW73730.1 Fe-S cluster assembly protein SufD [Alkalimarinus sediminis]